MSVKGGQHVGAAEADDEILRGGDDEQDVEQAGEVPQEDEAAAQRGARGDAGGGEQGEQAHGEVAPAGDVGELLREPAGGGEHEEGTTQPEGRAPGMVMSEKKVSARAWPRVGPNNPGRRRPLDKVRELQRRLWAAAKRQPGDASMRCTTASSGVTS
jgi:hypothetical protein